MCPPWRTRRSWALRSPSCGAALPPPPRPGGCSAHGRDCPWHLGLLALLDGLARAVPHDARVVAVGVQLEHRRNDAFDRLLACDHMREVPQVLLGFTDRP